MRILKNKPFSQWAKELKITDKLLIAAVDEITDGLFDANLGGHVYKKRLPLGHKGKRGGARTIVAFKFSDRAIFIYGYAKGARSNISDKEERALKDLAKIYFSYNEKQINEVIKSGILIEVLNEKINS